MVNLTTIGGLFAPAPETFNVTSLDTIIDLSVEGTYQINDRAEAFIQVQNLFGQEYQRLLNYPGRGMAFKLGALYRF